MAGPQCRVVRGSRDRQSLRPRRSRRRRGGGACAGKKVADEMWRETSVVIRDR